MTKLELIKMLVLIVYTSLVLLVVVLLSFSTGFRRIVYRIHKSPTDRYSWTRYIGSVIIVTALAVCILQATFSTVDTGLICTLVSIGFGAKVAQTGINRHK